MPSTKSCDVKCGPDNWSVTEVMGHTIGDLRKKFDINANYVCRSNGSDVADGHSWTDGADVVFVLKAAEKA